jgi:hypothetical protein
MLSRADGECRAAIGDITNSTLRRHPFSHRIDQVATTFYRNAGDGTIRRETMIVSERSGRRFRPDP